MKIFLKRLVAVLSAVLFVFATTALILVLCGYRPFVLQSPSMEPLYKEGSLCWVNTHIPLSDLKAGDVLAYRTPADALVLHRLVDIRSSSDEEMMVETQGDANPTAQEVTLSRINFVGREAFSISGLGSILSSASGGTSMLIVVLVVLACLPHLRLPRRIAYFLHKKETKAGDPA